MSRNRKAPSDQEEYRAQYRRLDNQVICILQQRWPANEVSEWVAMLQGKQQEVACAILRHRHPRPALLNLPAIGYEIQNPFQAKAGRPTVPVLSSDGRTLARTHVVPGKTPVFIDVSGTIHDANTGCMLWIAPDIHMDKGNPGAADRLNSTYQPALHQVVADHRQIEAGV